MAKARATRKRCGTAALGCDVRTTPRRPQRPRTAPNRITAKYRPHLQRIAELYVECGLNKSATERTVRAMAGLEAFQGEMLNRWLRTPEFAAVVKEAQAAREVQQKLRPEIRGPERIAWLCDVETALRTRHADAPHQEDRDKALKAALDVGKEIRAEEAHGKDLEVKQARKDFAAFIRNMVAYIKLKHSNAHATLFPVLRDILGNVEAIQAGKFEA